MSRAPSPRAPFVAAVGAGLVAAGFGFGAPSLLIPGLALALLALLAFGWVELAARGGRLERAPGPRRLAEGTPYPLRIRLWGTLLRPPGGELRDPLLERPAPVGPLWRRRLRRDVSLREPGRHQLGSATLLVRDPLGLWQRLLSSEPGGDVVVLPRLEPIRLLTDGGEAPGRGGSRSASGRGIREIAEADIDGLRPYRPGSPASRIHWPAVARHGELIERRLSSGAGSRPLVALDLRGPEGRPAAIRAAASLCFELARGGGCELLLPGARRTLLLDHSLRAWPQAHVHLALAAPGAPSAATATLRGGTVLWVASRGSPRPPAALGGGSWLFTPAQPLGEAELGVAGCYGCRIGERRRAGRALRAVA